MARALMVALVAMLCGVGSAEAMTLKVERSGIALAGVPLTVDVTTADLPPGAPVSATVHVDGSEVHRFDLLDGKQTIEIPGLRLSPGSHEIVVRSGEVSGTTSVRAIRGWLSVVPPLLAVALALIFKDVLISLFLAVLSGALIIYDWNPFTAFARTIDTIVIKAVADPDRVKIVGFTLLLGGMVGLITRSGGTLGIIAKLRKYASTPRRGQVATWLMGVFIFFDDYANALIVGSTMRPITDRLRISREKLAYIVDSTAAPISSVVPISTWIGFEVGLIAAAFSQLNLPFEAYPTFIATIPFRFYPIFALVFGFTIAVACRDFGPMLKAERRASETGKVIADGDTPLADYGSGAMMPHEGIDARAINAILPIVTVIGMTIAGLWISGASSVDRASEPTFGAYVQAVFSAASSLDALLWASLSALLVALILPVAQRILKLKEALEATVEGFRAMILATIVLILAWAIGAVCGDLHTADWVVNMTRDIVSPHWLSMIVFVTSAAIAFATGTSWGTMGILMPLVIPIAHSLAVQAGYAVSSEMYMTVLIGGISSVLAGSVWGDHCSPISDTTILSSIGSGSDHVAHFRTQLPYAVGVGLFGILIGEIPTAFGISPWISLLAGAIGLVLIVRIFGKRSDWQGGVAPAAER